MSGPAILVFLGDAFTPRARRAERGMHVTHKLGLEYLAATLGAHGIRSEIWDITVSDFTPTTLVETIRTTSPLLVGFHASTVTRQRVQRWIRSLRHDAPDLPILVGGPGHFSYEAFLDAGANLVCHGEGERTILDIVDHLEGSLARDRILGVAYVDGTRTIQTAERPRLDSLDDLPFPWRDPEHLSAYGDWRRINMRTNYATMITSRGCPRRCTYCAVPAVSGRAIRRRSVDNVLAEIDDLVCDKQVRYIHFDDDCFGSDSSWLESFCTRLKARGHDLIWACIAHPHTFDRDRAAKLAMMKQAGCDTIIFGLQAANPSMLENVGRHPSELNAVRESIAAAKRAGILTSLSFIFGLPGETAETIRESTDFAIRCRPNYAQFNSLVRIEGSEIFDRHGLDPVCGLNEEEIQAACKRALRAFYTHPRTMLRMAKWSCRQNPRALLRGGRYLRRLL